MDQDIQYIGTNINTSIVYIRSNIPYKDFPLKTQPPGKTRIYISTQVPTADIGKVGDLCVRRVKDGCDPSAVEVFWKGFRKNGIQTVWREIRQGNKLSKIQHPLHPTMRLCGFPACPLRPEWCKKSPGQQGQGDLNLSAVLFLRTHEAGSRSNPIDIS